MCVATRASSPWASVIANPRGGSSSKVLAVQRATESQLRGSMASPTTREQTSFTSSITSLKSFGNVSSATAITKNLLKNLNKLIESRGYGRPTQPRTHSRASAANPLRTREQVSLTQKCEACGDIGGRPVHRSDRVAGKTRRRVAGTWHADTPAQRASRKRCWRIWRRARAESANSCARAPVPEPASPLQRAAKVVVCWEASSVLEFLSSPALCIRRLLTSASKNRRISKATCRDAPSGHGILYDLGSWLIDPSKR